MQNRFLQAGGSCAATLLIFASLRQQSFMVLGGPRRTAAGDAGNRRGGSVAMASKSTLPQDDQFASATSVPVLSAGMLASSEPRWYAVHTRPHYETIAARQLANQAFDAFLPLHWKTVRHAR